MNQQPPSVQPEAKLSKPVMDVVTPRSAQLEPVKTPPQEEAPAQTESAELSSQRRKPEQEPSRPKPPKPLRSGTGLAIAATVVIVLGLAAMFVYAYLRTQGVSGY